MKLNLLSPEEVRADWQKDFVAEVVAALRRGESLQIVGMPGGGKSKLVEMLVVNKGVRKLHQIETDWDWLRLDLNLMPEKSSRGFFVLMGRGLGIESKADEVEMIMRIEDEISRRLKEKGRLVLILDNFENLVDDSFTATRQILMGLQEKNRAVFGFVTVAEREMAVEGRFNRVLQQNVMWLPMLDFVDGSWCIRTWAKEIGVKLDEARVKQIYRQSGGFMRTMKRLVEMEAKDTSINLDYHLSELLSFLADDLEILKQICKGEKVEESENLQRLRKMGVVEGERIRLPLLAEKIRQMMGLGEEKYLTRSEEKLWQMLKTGEGVIEKEKLIEALWGEAAVDISNHALDQLVCRLRKKLRGKKPRVEIKTVFGRGYEVAVYN